MDASTTTRTVPDPRHALRGSARATNLYGKFNFDLEERNRITAIVADTDFINRNAEGLNLEQVRQDPVQAS